MSGQPIVNPMDLDAPPKTGDGILDKMFRSCAPDPRGSVHRAWGISLLFVVVYFALSIFESKLVSFDVCKRLLWFRGIQLCACDDSRCSGQRYFETAVSDIPSNPWINIG